MADLASAKRYMRVEGDEDDELIQALMDAAELYLTDAGVPPLPHPLYNLALWSLTLHYYDHRDAVGDEHAFPAGLRPVINQLKLLGGYQ